MIFHEDCILVRLLGLDGEMDVEIYWKIDGKMDVEIDWKMDGKMDGGKMDVKMDVKMKEWEERRQALYSHGRCFCELALGYVDELFLLQYFLYDFTGYFSGEASLLGRG